MSLVDYASSSDEDAHDDEHIEAAQRISSEAMKIEPPRYSPPQKPQIEQHLHQYSRNATSSSGPIVEKLPDASLLLNSPDFSSSMFNSNNNHTSQATTATAENASRKRMANGAPFCFTQAKLPKGNLPRPRNASVNGLLLPPQLNGRSNVVTEDITKLFVRKQPDHPSH